MKILLNKQTADSDLKTGLKVCYKNTDGVFNNLGVITDIITDKDGIKNYIINTSFGAYMADELKLISDNNLNSVLVKFENEKYNYNTNVSAKCDEITAMQYFVGKLFDMGIYPAEDMQKCIGIEFTDNNTVKHHSGMVYNPQKTYYVCGARNAWDTVKVGLFDSEESAKGCFPDFPKCVRQATDKEVKDFFKIIN